MRARGLGRLFVAPLDVVFSPFAVVEPDLLYISEARSPVLTEKNVQGAPDLVVEIVSETTASVDRTTKLKLYARYGVLEYWIIDPNGPSAQIYGRVNEGFELVANLQAGNSLASPLFPGFNLPLGKLVE